MRCFVPWRLNDRSLAIHCQEKVPLKSRLRRGGCELPRHDWFSPTTTGCTSRGDHTRRGGDGSRFACIAGNELPGYDHSVPTGRSPVGAVYRVALFYGRSRAVDETIDLLRRRAEAAKPFVLVFGSSGVGKSSLVRAGVLPQLLKPGVIEGIGHWRHAIFRPSDGLRLINPCNAGDPRRITTRLYLRAYGLNRGLAKALMRPEAIGVECPATEHVLMRAWTAMLSWPARWSKRRWTS
jgi:hypothetical protein